MGVQRYRLPSGAVRYRARVKSHGREVAARVFERRADAVAWEQDQRRRLRLGEWIDPRRGQVPLWAVAADWLGSRGSVKRRTRETDEAAWRNYVQPRSPRGQAGRRVVAGTGPSTGAAQFPLSAAQAEVGAKTNEVPMATAVLGVTSSRSPWRRAFGITLSRTASSARSSQFRSGRRGCCRCRTASWWRRIKISAVCHASSRRDSCNHEATRVIRRKTNRRHMTGDHHGRGIGEQLCWSELWMRFSARTGSRNGETDHGR